MTPLRILIADDHEVVRRGLRALLDTDRDGRQWTVCGEASTGQEAVETAKQLKPDVVILDISMPRLNGLDAARMILKTAPHTKILILTMHESEELIRNVLDTGARGYVFKSDAGRDLVAAVDAVQRGKFFFTSKVGEKVLRGYLTGQGGAEAILESQQQLTPREREIVQLLAEGKSSKEVAMALNLSVKTAETHRANIMRKLDLHSISELVRYAIRNNITQP
ncbi:MAG TPA: response regulator transcription factor [Candidatus Acidoferrales bacterium]|nr:response regulator transcription factor [Candidatus Acidoferrales bacterium]